MTVTLETGLSEGLKVQFINEMVVLHNLKNVTTSDKVEENKVNIKMSNPKMLDYVINKIDKTGLNIKVNNPTDTVIALV
jgi:hypothetical protein